MWLFPHLGSQGLELTNVKDYDWLAHRGQLIGDGVVWVVGFLC